MAVRIVPARQATPPPERPLWRLVRGERTAHALIRQWPHGNELCVLVDGEFRYGRLHRGTTGELDAHRDSQERRRQLEAIGLQGGLATDRGTLCPRPLAVASARWAGARIHWLTIAARRAHMAG